MTPKQITEATELLRLLRRLDVLLSMLESGGTLYLHAVSKDNERRSEPLVMPPARAIALVRETRSEARAQATRLGVVFEGGVP